MNVYSQFSLSPHSNDTAHSASRAVIDAENWFSPVNALLGTQNRVLKDISAENSSNEGMNIANSNRGVGVKREMVTAVSWNREVRTRVIILYLCLCLYYIAHWCRHTIVWA
jgi:hypothetical protein